MIKLESNFLFYHLDSLDKYFTFIAGSERCLIVLIALIVLHVVSQINDGVLAGRVVACEGSVRN